MAFVVQLDKGYSANEQQAVTSIFKIIIVYNKWKIYGSLNFKSGLYIADKNKIWKRSWQYMYGIKKYPTFDEHIVIIFVTK